jgi:hypothetical protein
LWIRLYSSLNKLVLKRFGCQPNVPPPTRKIRMSFPCLEPHTWPVVPAIRCRQLCGYNINICIGSRRLSAVYMTNNRIHNAVSFLKLLIFTL